MAEFLPDFASLDQFNQEALRALALATKASNGIPSDRKEDWDFYTTFKSFRQVTDAQSDTIRKLIGAFVNHNGIKCSIPRNDSTNTSDILEMLSDFNDQLLERISSNLDEAVGLKTEIDPVLVEITDTRKTDNNVKLLAGKNITRPQLAFKGSIDNSVKSPFIPKLTDKPHSLKPLSILIEYSDLNEEIYSHPYVFEIDNLKLPAQQLEKISLPNKVLDLDETPMVFVDDKRQLEQVIKDLSDCTEIGVDLEAHSYRSFQGIACLIQISSPVKDYIIDPFPLWSDLTLLNEIFANPRILKIFHGAKNDIQWLQRDFSIYVVNMFDTYIATQVLDFPRGCRSLAFLLHSVAKKVTDKKFQMADWRMRPLPQEMIKYARIDTHYMIKIYNELKTKLIDQSNENLNLLRSVFDQSNELCKTRYQKPAFKEDQTFLDKLQKGNITHFNAKQKYAFRGIFSWRNAIARQEDESEHYVLPFHMLLKICAELPREMQGILACTNPVPPLVKQNLHALHEIILKAREQNKLEQEDNVQNLDFNKKQGQFASSKLEILQDPLKCPLDMSNWDPENYDEGLEVLLDKTDMKTEASTSIQAKEKAHINAFDNQINREGNKLNKVFLSPFERYKMLKPYMDSMNTAAPKTGEIVTDEDRIKSIKQHFDTLTALTPQDMTSENSVTKNEQVESSDSDENIEETTIDDYDPDPGEAKKLRQGLEPWNKSNKSEIKEMKKKRSGATTELPEDGSQKKAKIDMENVDLSQYSRGVKQNAKTFDPMKGFRDGAGKNKNSGRAKQRGKNKSGKSMTYKN